MIIITINTIESKYLTWWISQGRITESIQLVFAVRLIGTWFILKKKNYENRISIIRTKDGMKDTKNKAEEMSLRRSIADLLL